MSEKPTSVFQNLDVALEQRREFFEFVGFVGSVIDRLEPALCDGLRFALRKTERAERMLELSNRCRLLGLGGRWLRVSR